MTSAPPDRPPDPATELRRLEPGDGRLLRTAVRGLLAAEDGSHRVAATAHLDGALADARNYFLVALEGAEPVGYLSAFRFPDVHHDGLSAYLYDIVVRPDRRRRGVATAMLGRLEELCRADGVDAIWLGTSPANLAACRTFEGTGAVRVAESYVEYIYDLSTAGGREDPA